MPHFGELKEGGGGGGGGAGTVTSVNLSAPAAGITATGGPVTGSGSITLALADDLAAVESISTFGWVKRTALNVWGTVTGIVLTTDVSGILPVANGGSGTATPAIVAGTGIAVTGAWPNQTIDASSGLIDSAAIDAAFGSTRGSVLVRGALTWIVRIPTIAGTVLTFDGLDAVWAALPSPCPDYSMLALQETGDSYAPPLGGALDMTELDCPYTPPALI